MAIFKTQADFFRNLEKSYGQNPSNNNKEESKEQVSNNSSTNKENINIDDYI